MTGTVELIATPSNLGRVIGADVTIYDPELDPVGTYVPDIVPCLVAGLAPLRETAWV